MAVSPIGRPSKYRPEYCEQLVKHMSEGFTFESFAGLIGVCKDTLYEWKRVHPEFLDAHKRGEPACRLHWERIGMAGMYRGGQNDPFQASIWIFTMKARFGYSDRQSIEIKPASPDAPEDKELFKNLVGQLSAIGGGSET